MQKQQKYVSQVYFDRGMSDNAAPSQKFSRVLVREFSAKSATAKSTIF
jgi:hypothetical protein